MIGNTNASTMGGGTLKVLNVTQYGTLDRDDAKISGFKMKKQAYLTFASRLNNGYLNLDSTNYNKNLGTAFASANSWEAVFKVFFFSNTGFTQPLMCEDRDFADSSIIGISEEPKLWLVLYNSTGQIVTWSSGATFLSMGQWYYIKIEFTGTHYNMYYSTDGITYNLDLSKESSQKLDHKNNWIIGSFTASSSEYNYRIDGYLDLEFCYIKINGEYWWKGVEKL